MGGGIFSLYFFWLSLNVFVQFAGTVDKIGWLGTGMSRGGRVICPIDSSGIRMRCGKFLIGEIQSFRVTLKSWLYDSY